MTGPQQNNKRNGSERLIYVVVAWMIAVGLVPIHALVVFSYLQTDQIFALAVLSIFLAAPLLVVDYFVFRWFRDNIRVFRWIQRGNGARR